MADLAGLFLAFLSSSGQFPEEYSSVELQHYTKNVLEKCAKGSLTTGANCRPAGSRWVDWLVQVREPCGLMLAIGWHRQGPGVCSTAPPVEWCTCCCCHSYWLWASQPEQGISFPLLQLCLAGQQRLTQLKLETSFIISQSKSGGLLWRVETECNNHLFEEKMTEDLLSNNSFSESASSETNNGTK